MATLTYSAEPTLVIPLETVKRGNKKMIRELLYKKGLLKRKRCPVCNGDVEHHIEVGVHYTICKEICCAWNAGDQI